MKQSAVMDQSFQQTDDQRNPDKSRIRLKDHLERFAADRTIFYSMMALIIIGIVMVTSVRLSEFGSTMSLLVSVFKEGLLAFMGLALGFICAGYFSYKKSGRWIKLSVLLYLGLMAAVYLIGTEINGAKSWLNFGPFSIQPSEFAKPLLIALFAWSLYQADHAKKEKSINLLIGKPAAFYGVALLLTLLQKDIGTAVIITLIFMVCLLIPSYKILAGYQKVTRIIFISLLCGGIVYCNMDSLVNITSTIPGISHIATRVENMKNPYADYYDKGFQPSNALYAMAEGGVFGKGIGKSARKYGYLTQAESDYIGSVIIEEVGMVGMSVVIVLYGLIIWRLFKAAFMARSRPDKVLFGGTAAYLFAHIFINLAGITCLIPMTGVPLLMVSKGGSAMMAFCISAGLCQSRIADLKAKGEFDDD